MIKDIPTSEEFHIAAKAQFDFAWDIVISFLLMLSDASEYSDVEPEDEDSFWDVARQRILTSLIIAQQGVELAIKAKLVEISPYLLISGNYSDWPKDSSGTGVNFSDFRAIDAQDLIKVYNTVSDTKFDQAFSELFDKLRKQRNKAMHTVSKDQSISAKEVILVLLDVHEYLYSDENWVETRRDFLLNSAETHVNFDTDYIPGRVVKEFLIVFKLLTPSQKKRFFKINEKQRLYYCPQCKYESDKYESLEPKYAVLDPNEPDSTTLFCFVCNDRHMVDRVDCSLKCPGNVISCEHDICCTCGESQHV